MNAEQEYYENEQFWDGSAGHFSEADQERFELVKDAIPRDCKTLLDAGCGNGLFLEALRVAEPGRFTRMCGTDRSTAALKFVRAEKYNASIDDLPFADGEFDIVTCQEVLEHLPQAIFARALFELSRVARQYLLITVPFDEPVHLHLAVCAMCGCRFNSHYHLRSFNDAKMRSLIEPHGFSCAKVFHIFKRKTVPVGIETFLQIGGQLKRFALRQPSVPMPAEAVCPACGFTPRMSGTNGPEVRRAKAAVSTTVRNLLSVQSSWRWVGGLYQRR